MPLNIDLEQEELHDYLRVDLGVDDTIINIMLETALNEAETFLNTDYSMPVVTTETNEDGTTTDTITVIQGDVPAAVKMWVLSRIAQLYEFREQAAAPNFTLLQPHRVLPFRGI